MCLVATLAAVTRYVTAGTRAADTARTRAQAEAARVAAQIEDTVQSVIPIVTLLAQDLAAQGLSEPMIQARLQDAIGRNPHLTAVTAAFERQAFAPDRKLFAPTLRRLDARVTPARIDARYDYTDYKYHWYTNAILDGPGWALMTLEDGDDAAAYCAPFYYPGADPKTADPRGAACAAIPLDAISGAVQGLQLGSTGYAFAFARNGQYLSHPRRELIEQRRSVFQTAWESGNTALNSMAVRATKGERGSISSFEPLTGDVDWMFFEPVPSAGWTVVTVFPRSAFALEAAVQRHMLFLIVLGAIATLALTGNALVRTMSFPVAQRLWTDATVLALLLSAGVGVLWWITDRHPATTGDAGTPLLGREAVEQYLHANGARDRSGTLRPLVRIPTGVYVRSIAFQSSTDVTVTGVIWQRYTDGAHDGVVRGFAMPEADTITDKQVTELYRTKANGEERIGWQFIVKLREHFSYARYPFDRQRVSVRLRPADLRPDVVLVPDFEGYPIMDPAALPGVTRELVLPGWEATSAFFDYRLHSYTTNFGLKNFHTYEDGPELYYNVSLRRLFLGPFVSSIVPLSVAVAMLFGVLVISTRKDKSTSLFGFSAESSLRSAAALFFVVAFQHVALRNQLSSPVLMYFEYFYFAVDLAILLVSINAVVFAAQMGVRVVEHRENLIPKLLFWPLWTGAMFMISYVALY